MAILEESNIGSDEEGLYGQISGSTFRLPICCKPDGLAYYCFNTPYGTMCFPVIDENGNHKPCGPHDPACT